MINVIAAAEWGGEFDGALDNVVGLFDMPDIIELSLFGIDLSINRTILIIWIMTALAGGLFIAGLRNSRIVPGKLQAMCEMVVDFIRNIAIDIIGPKGTKFVPLLTTMFLFVFFMNIAKITPIFMLPPTSRMAIAGLVALTAWGVYVTVGVRTHGFFGYLKAVAVPSGVPVVLLIILIPIEFISNLIVRPFALAIRLFANMVAGHILVVVTLVAVHVFLYPRPGLPVGIVALALSPAVFAFELFIIGLQAYIFTLLTAVYIGSSMESH